VEYLSTCLIFLSARIIHDLLDRHAGPEK